MFIPRKLALGENRGRDALALGRIVLLHTHAGSPAGSLALSGHRGIVTGHVHGKAAAARDIGGEVHGKTIGVVEDKGLFARNHTFAHVLQSPVQVAHALLQGRREPLFLGTQHPLGQLARFRQFRERRAHRLFNGPQHPIKEGIVDAQIVAVAQRAPNDAAQHVTASLVGRKNAVAHEKGRGARMIGDDLQRVGPMIIRPGYFAGGEY